MDKQKLAADTGNIGPAQALSADTSKTESDGPVARILSDLENTPNFEIFHDQCREPYAKLPIESGTICLAIESKGFREWLEYFLYKQKRRITLKHIIDNVVAHLVGIAKYQGKQYELNVRTARQKEDIWYDLHGSAVRIFPNGWEIVGKPPVLFRNYPIQRAQVSPSRNPIVEISDIFRYINVQRPNDRILLLVYLVAGFVPDFPHPILAIHGPQGSAKTTLTKIILRLLDPCNTEDVPFYNIGEFQRAASKRWVIPLDNTSRISPDRSDLLCKIVTGTGDTVRKLFTNDEDVIRHFRRIILLNGISLPLERADALDRSIVLRLDRIPDSQRRDEAALISEFEELRPQLLSACFDILGRALSIYPKINLKKFERLADFTKWGYAIAMAMGQDPNTFLKAYHENVGRQVEDAIEADPVASLIQRYLQRNLSLEGTPSQVLAALAQHAPEMLINQRCLPASAKAFGRALERCKTNLESIGIEIVRERSIERRIIIRRGDRFQLHVGNDVRTTTWEQDIIAMPPL